MKKEQLPNQKMEENKYYTPEIEEFHLGFKYEVFDPINNKWETQTIDDFYGGYDGETTLSEIEYSLREDTAQKDKRVLVRVQYLSKEDIEAEGFVKDSGDYDFIKGEFQIELFGGKVNISREYGASVLFFGTIKNRSELKKILKMIEVC